MMCNAVSSVGVASARDIDTAMKLGAGEGCVGVEWGAVGRNECKNEASVWDKWELRGALSVK